jgi:phage virion morphogenesis protein
MITIELTSDSVGPALQRVAEALDETAPLMAQIAEYLVVSTKRRFPTGKGPTGAPWAPKSPVTLASYGARKSNRVDNRPLFGPSGQLNSQIFPESGPDFAAVGSNRVYAAMMQFGGTKAAFPHLWGNIPARPFLGFSDEDETAILQLLADGIGAAFAPG